MNIPSWLRGSVVIGVTLVAGVAIGMAVERHHGRLPFTMHARMTHGSHDGGGPTHIAHLAEVLSLDSAQRRSVEAILARHQGTIDSSWYAMQPRVHATLQTAMHEILAVLRPDQATRLRVLVETMHPGVIR